MIVWGQRSAGTLVTKLAEDEAVIIGHTQIGDHVRFPSGHPRHGEQSTIVDRGYAPCPQCESESVHYLLDSGSHGVAECSNECGFVWYERNI